MDTTNTDPVLDERREVSLRLRGIDVAITQLRPIPGENGRAQAERLRKRAELVAAKQILEARARELRIMADTRRKNILRAQELVTAKNRRLIHAIQGVVAALEAGDFDRAMRLARSATGEALEAN